MDEPHAAPASATARVFGSSMHYRHAGDGPPVVLLHGNPTSSHLWRHVLRDVEATGHRWIAPDLIGMGDSSRPDLVYSLADHVSYVEWLLDALGLWTGSGPVLVGHDWGVAIAMVLLRRYPDRVRGLAVMEGHLHPLPGWGSFDEGGRELFRRLRTPGEGERMVLEENFFLDTLLPAALVNPLPEADLRAYRAPYPTRESRRPLLQWAREIPIGGEPAHATQLMADAAEQLARSDVPVLLARGRPGVLVTDQAESWLRRRARRLTVADVGGPAGHFLPEDRPDQVRQVLHDWVRTTVPA